MLCKSRNWNNNSNDWKDNNIRTGGTDQECEHYNKTFNQTVCSWHKRITLSMKEKKRNRREGERKEERRVGGRQGKEAGRKERKEGTKKNKGRKGGDLLIYRKYRRQRFRLNDNLGM